MTAIFASVQVLPAPVVLGVAPLGVCSRLFARMRGLVRVFCVASRVTKAAIIIIVAKFQFWTGEFRCRTIANVWQFALLLWQCPVPFRNLAQQR